MPAQAQTSAPVGVVRGEMIEWQGTANAGKFTVRTAENQVYSCHFDGFSYMERDGQRIGASALKSGDKLEIIADHKPGTASCYARTIRVAENRAAVVNPGYRVNLRPSPRTSTADLLYPRGNMTFAGVVLRMNPEMIVLRTRTEHEKVVRLRQDTRYLDSGEPSTRGTLAVNTRVFVRAGRNLDDEVEAYQVIWGQIPGPK
jgi:hypothetical protein